MTSRWSCATVSPSTPTSTAPAGDDGPAASDRAVERVRQALPLGRWPVRSVFTQGADISDYAPIEAPDPLTWCPAGYAHRRPPTRAASNASEGDADPPWVAAGRRRHSRHDRMDRRAVLGRTARSGWAGASYFGIVQWFCRRPPRPAAPGPRLLPYDGMSDLYREIVAHGGIPQSGLHLVLERAGRGASRNLAENWMTAMRIHPFFDEYWQSKVPAGRADRRADLCRFRAGATMRSTRAARCRRFNRLGTEQKWLEVHGPQQMGRECTPRKSLRPADRLFRPLP